MVELKNKKKMLVIVNVVNGLSVVHPESPTTLRGSLAK